MYLLPAGTKVRCANKMMIALSRLEPTWLLIDSYPLKQYTHHWNRNEDLDEAFADIQFAPTDARLLLPNVMHRLSYTS